jgi:hypothetical protein
MKETRLMRRQISGLLAVAVMALFAGTAWGQGEMNYEVPLNNGLPAYLAWLPGPLGHPRYEDGGIFVAMEFVYYNQTNPIRDQIVAIRGFQDDDGSITGRVGTFVGSGTEALNTLQVHGPTTYEPGFNLIGGWRFNNGFVLQIGWIHLQEAQFAGVASTLPGPAGGTRGVNLGGTDANTFLFSPVFNFPPDFAGPPQKVAVGNPGATYGIWNAATTMGIRFLQRFDQYDMTGRVPIWQTDRMRSYGLFGPRIVHLWEQFKWRTIDEDINGNTNDSFNADYTNTLSQSMYGAHAGCGADWWLGQTPVGGFSWSLDGEAALYYDFAKERARYELADRTIAFTHNRNVGALVPALNARVSLWYYPLEAIQIRVGYDAMVFFNTFATTHPIDFNLGALAPLYNTGYTRLLQGFSAGLGIVF